MAIPEKLWTAQLQQTHMELQTNSEHVVIAYISWSLLHSKKRKKTNRSYCLEYKAHTIVLLGSNDSDSRSCILLFTERTTFGRSSIGSRPYLLQNRYQNLEIPYIMQYKSHFQSDKPTTIEQKLLQGEHPYFCSPIMQAVKLTSMSQNIHNTSIVKDKRGFRAQHTEQLLPEETEPSVQQQVCHHVSHLILCVADLHNKYFLSYIGISLAHHLDILLLSIQACLSLNTSTSFRTHQRKYEETCTTGRNN